MSRLLYGKIQHLCECQLGCLFQLISLHKSLVFCLKKNGGFGENIGIYDFFGGYVKDISVLTVPDGAELNNSKFHQITANSPQTRVLAIKNENRSKDVYQTDHITSQTPVAPSEAELREERKRIQVTIFRLTESRIIQHFLCV